MKFRLNLRLQNDLDLLTLYCNPGFPFKILLIAALNSYAADKRIHPVSLPPPYKQENLSDSCIYLSFNKRKDPAIFNWLESIQPGQRTNAIKTVFRCCLQTPCLDAFYVAENTVKKTTKKQGVFANVKRKKTPPPEQDKETAKPQDETAARNEFDVFDLEISKF